MDQSKDKKIIYLEELRYAEFCGVQSFVEYDMEWRIKMERLPRARYSQEFREQSVKFFKENGLTLIEAARRLSLPKGTLKNWVHADRQGELTTVGKYQKPLSGFIALAYLISELSQQ